MTASTPLPGFDQLERPPRDKITSCIHCGLCLDKCPTYRTLGTEMDSPRGRIYLIKAVDDGRLAMTPNFVEHMYLCLDCRACETACPSHVQFGDLMEKARGQIERQLPHPWPERLLRRLVFQELFPHPRRLEFLCHVLRWYQRLGLQRLVRHLDILELFPGLLKRLEATLPEGADPAIYPQRSGHLAGQAASDTAGRIFHWLRHESAVHRGASRQCPGAANEWLHTLDTATAGVLWRPAYACGRA